MAATSPRRDEGLSHAFEVFNQVSEHLAASYHTLEARVAELNAELSVAHTERLKDLSEKARLANRLQHLLTALPGGVVVLDGNGRIDQCNPAGRALLGEPLLGERWSEVIERAFAPRPHDGHEVSLRDGRLVSVATRSLEPEPGQIVMLTDMTGTRALQESVSRHRRLSAMGEMAASLAHQIRTPLASALLYVAHLTRPLLDEPDRRRIAEKIRARLRHLEQLVNDMLVFARGGSGIATGEIRLGDLLLEFRQMLEAALQQGDCTVSVAGDTKDLVLRGNREALLGALLNLATNAIKACGPGGRLSLSVTSDQTTVDLRLADNGPGIPPELHERIFEPFFTTRPDGTGLGLPVVQAVARAHHGSVSLESNPGHGSAFTLRLPLAGGM